MDKARFSEILKEYDYSDEEIKQLWDSRPSDELDAQRLRETAKEFAGIED